MCEKIRMAWRKATQDAPREPTEADRRLLRAVTYVQAFLIFVALPFAIMLGACNKDPASTDAWTRILVASMIPMVYGMFILVWKSTLNECFDPPLGGPTPLNPTERLKLCIWGVMALVLLPMVLVWSAYGADLTDVPMWKRIGASLILPALNVMALSACYLAIKRASTHPRRDPE